MERYGASAAPEILKRPRGLVKIIGLRLDEPEDHPHQQVWAALTSARTPESVPLSYQMVADPATVFPQRKAKVKRDPTDDDVVPSGIIKSNWVKKHRNTVPSVVVAFFDLDWQAEDWETREAECAKTINELRDSMDGRSTRVVAVLMQEKPLADGDPMVEARAVSLRNACLLKTRSSLFALPSPDPTLKSMVVRLESAFFELSTKYYEDSEQHVQSQMEALNIGTETILAVRYNVKIAYFNELRQLRQPALKAYMQAYSLLKDSQAPGVPLSEVKSVEGLLTAKICQIQFSMQTPVDALTQFREHLQFFGGQEGRKALHFRHCGWMAEQYYLFALVFEEAVRNGLTALQTEHPGYYFFQAAQQTQRQKLAVQRATKALAVQPAKADVLEPDYVGQHKIVFSELTDPSETPADNETFTLLMGEAEHNHSETIITLCNRALEQFKKVTVGKRALPVKVDRMVNRINVYKATELYDLEKFEDAEAAIAPAIVEYRAEGWDDLLAVTLRFSYRIAYNLGDAEALASRAIEMSGGGMRIIAAEQRAQALQNLLKIVSGSAPEVVAGCATSRKWDTPKTQTLACNMSALRKSIECRVLFERKSVLANEELSLFAVLRSSLAETIAVRDITATFRNESYADAKVTAEGLTELAPGKTVVRMTLRSCETTTHDVVCSTISFWIGDEVHGMKLTWDVTAGRSLADDAASRLYEEDTVKRPTLEQLDWPAVPTVSAIAVLQLPAKVALSYDHEKPALVKELYKLVVHAKSEEDLEMFDVKMSFKILENDAACEHATLCGKLGADTGESQATWDLDPIAPGDLATKDVYMRFSHACNVVIAVTLQYCTAASGDDEKWERTTATKEQLAVIIPISATFRLETLERGRHPQMPNNMGDAICAKEPFLMQMQIVTNVPWPLEIKSLALAVNDAAPPNEFPMAISTSPLATAAGVVLHPKEVLAECCCLSIPDDDAHPPGRSPLGVLLASWKRPSAAEATSSVSALPTVTIAPRAISVHAKIAPTGYIRTPTVLTYTIKNHSRRVQEIQVEVEKSKAFIFSGCQRMMLKVLPGRADRTGRIVASEKQICYNIVPLIGGQLPLPTINMKLVRTREVISKIHGPGTVFIKHRAVSDGAMVETPASSPPIVAS